MPATFPRAHNASRPPPLPYVLREYGRIAAGAPLEAVEECQRSELLELLTAPGRYALRVGDDSMCDAGIFAGDYVIVQSQRDARDGDIVIALLDEEQVLLKRIRYCGGERVLLLADSPGSVQLELAAARLSIQGRVVGQLRRYT